METSDNKLIIGVDCAADPNNVGLALGVLAQGATGQILAVEPARRDRDGDVWTQTASQIADWVRGASCSLIAMDAPLGWPLPLAKTLTLHEAGQAVGADAHMLFRRETDRFVRKMTGKQSLDVGADRIARAAHGALRLLARVRETLGEPIPLAWGPSDTTRVTAIEVYPAATLRQHGIPAGGYKGAANSSARAEIGGQLPRHGLHIDGQGIDTTSSDHLLDAVLCVLAGLDFLKNQAFPPDDASLARKEGWIWVADPSRCLCENASLARDRPNG